MRMEPFLELGYKLLQEGAEEMARVESNGIRVDVSLLHQTKSDLKEKLREARSEMEKSDVFRHWRRRFGAKTNLAARDQKAYVVYDVLKTPRTKFTETGLDAVDDEVLQNIDHPFVKLLARYSKLDKALGTFLSGIEFELIGDRIHPFFDLHTARTFRSSSSYPNFQNFPVRDKDIAKLIRSLFIPSPGCCFGENDFKGIEVGMSACYHKDPVFISYLRDESSDMHRDMAAQCYMLEEFLGNWKWPSAKDIRYGAKNKFVFPEFYGAWYKACAKDLWEWIAKGKLAAPDGKSLYEHLRSKGISELGACDPEEDPVKGTFEYHLKEVEKDFWGRRFKVYDAWKKSWYESYLENRYFELLSGFRIFGMYDRKQVCNYPIQGSAFHCLLWCLVQIAKKLRKYRMRSMVVGQIHDSVLGDIPCQELRNYMEIAEDVVRNELPKHFRWIEVPLEIEFELASPGKSWHDKKEFKFRDGQFKHPEKDLWTRNTDAFLSLFAAQKKSDQKSLEPRTGHRSNFEVPKIQRDLLRNN